MGKKTDRMYITTKEWMQDFGGKKANNAQPDANLTFKPLPFYCCSLSMQPFEDPVCTPDGIVFDVTNILPWLKKHTICPITGKPLQSKDLFALRFHKNENGKYHCPITYKEFTDYSHIVAIRTSGHVFSYDAIEELNIKPKSWKCLMTDTPFTRQDIITIQDPNNLERRNMSNFHFVKSGIKLTEEDEDPLNNIQISESKKKMLRELNEKHEKQQAETKQKQKEEEERGYTRVNAVSASFTASNISGGTVRVDARDVIKNVDKKGYVRIHTNAGDLNIELHCDMAPKTCENFLALCKKGYYNKTKFHRLIPNILIQGGDPTGTGRGGESIWGKPFKDEFSSRLQHSARGIVSMGNAGLPDTNTSQFFITFAPCSQMNFKHTVFGKVVGGNETLSKMEEVQTDKLHRPLEDVIITGVTVFVDPFAEETQEEKKQREEKERQEKERKKEEEQVGQWYSNPIGGAAPKAVRQGVGKYIKLPEPAKSSNNNNNNVQTGTKRSAESTNPSPRPEKKTNL